MSGGISIPCSAATCAILRPASARSSGGDVPTPSSSSAGHLPAFSTLQRAGLLWIRPARDGQVAHLVELDVDRPGPGGAPGLGKGALARAGGSREHMTIRAPPRAPCCAKNLR